MTKQRFFLTAIFAIALGLGVWTVAAVTFTTVHGSNFSAGDQVSAADFNQRFNDIDSNFASAEGQINTNESNISSNDTDISALQSGKVDVAGDTMTGTLTIDRGDGQAALFQNQSDSSPTLYLKNAGNGPILQAVTPSGGVLEVSTDGSIRIGGSSTNPAIRLDGTSGTITNNIGSGLPAAFAVINPGSPPTLVNATSNVSNPQNPAIGVYTVDLDITSVNPVVVATAYNTINPRMVSYSASGSSGSVTLTLNRFDDAGNPSNGRLSFVVHETN